MVFRLTTQRLNGAGIMISFEVAKLIPGSQVPPNPVRVRFETPCYTTFSFGLV